MILSNNSEGRTIISLAIFWKVYINNLHLNEYVCILYWSEGMIKVQTEESYDGSVLLACMLRWPATYLGAHGGSYHPHQSSVPCPSAVWHPLSLAVWLSRLGEPPLMPTVPDLEVFFLFQSYVLGFDDVIFGKSP